MTRDPRDWGQYEKAAASGKATDRRAGGWRVPSTRRLIDEDAGTGAAPPDPLSAFRRPETRPAATGLPGGAAALWDVTINALAQRDEAIWLRSQADQAIRDKAGFIAALAHELKNPLNAIYGYAQLLQMANPQFDHAQRQDRLKTIEQAARHLIDLTGDMLSAAQIEAGAVAIDPTEFDFAAMVRDIVEIAAPAIRIRGNVLAIEVAPDLGVIRSDRTKLSQILINLLSNAGKFTEHGKVTLRAQRLYNDEVEITVSDTGIGLSAEQQARLFSAFSNIGGKHSRELGGHGLGLFITANLIQLLGGRIEVDSAPGKGTRFALRLPAANGNGAAELEKRPADSLAIGFLEALPTLDPHAGVMHFDMFLLDLVYECLTAIGPDGSILPALATAWRRHDDLTWEFELRRDAVFHDGQALDAEDIIASFNRMRRLSENPKYVVSYIGELESWSAIGQSRLRLRTREPNPMLLRRLAQMAIISRRFAGVDASGFESGAAAIGTGPYRLAGVRPREFHLAFNPNRRFKTATWHQVICRMPQDGGNLQRDLVEGRIDLLSRISFDSVASLRSNPELKIWNFPAPDVIMLWVNHAVDATRIAFHPDGRPVEGNPFRDLRLRRALSLAIDRQFLCDHVLHGLARPASSIVPSGVIGANPDLEPDPYDPARARRLLAEAGFPEGLTIRIGAMDDWRLHERRVLRALEVMLQAAGIRLILELKPLREHYCLNEQPDFGLKIGSWICGTGDAEENLGELAGTYTPRRGSGVGNDGLYSNPALDSLLTAIRSEMDPSERVALLRRADALAMMDLPLIPLVFTDGVAAAKRGLSVAPNVMGIFKPQSVERSEG